MRNTIESLLWIAAFLALAFLFIGTPDLWDKLHERAMSAAECKAPAATPEAAKGDGNG